MICYVYPNQVRGLHAFTTVWPLKITTASSLVSAHQISTHVNSIAEVRGCKVLEHKTEVSSSVWAKRQSRLRCLEGLDEAVLLSVSKVNEVIFNRELIIWHNGATDQAGVPLDQISPNTDVTQQTVKKKKTRADIQILSRFFFFYYSTFL